MPAPRGKKRKSELSTTFDAPEMSTQQIPTKSDSHGDGPSPMKKRKIGISLAQKQALIDNLQLEITERARKLRANYNLHAQSLRTRIEIRINRIPTSLRKATMGDLLLKYSQDQPKKPTRAAAASRPPPVPEKDLPPSRGAVSRPVTATSAASRPATAASAASRHTKHTNDEMSGGDKENVVEHTEQPKKKTRGAAAAESSRNMGQVLSPTSSNSRVVPRDRPASPAKSMIARPVSPVKTASATNLLSSMVEKARATRATAAQRKATNSSTTSSSNGSSAASTARTRRGAAATTAASTTRATASRAARRVSESSDGSTSTVVRKRVGTTATKAAPAPAKRAGVMSTIKKGVTAASGRKAAATKAAPAPATSSTGRVLRKRV